jgi:DNA polymerase
MGYTIVLSVHDEAIAEVPEDFGSVSEFLSVMTALPKWGAGFPLKAEGSEGRRYAKA